MIRFLLKILLYSFLTIGIYLGIVWVLIHSNTAVYQFLYLYHIEKIHKSDDAEIAFVGDSSLGNGIHQGKFQQLSGMKTLNVALTGNYGYAGSYNMLKTVHRRHRGLRYVVVMQALDMMTRQPAYNGYVRTTRHPADFTELSFAEKKEFIKHFRKYITSIFNDEKKESGVIERDYIAQTYKGDFSEYEKMFYCKDIKPEKALFLRKIVNYCRENDLKLIYLHGPLLESVVERSRDYKECADQAVRATGAKLIPVIFTLENEEAGDTADHVIPSLRKLYTEKYYLLMKDILD